MNLPDSILSIIQDYDLEFYGNSRYKQALQYLHKGQKREAFALLEDAATNADHADACFEVAKAYLWNLGLTMPNFTKALAVAQKGHQLGHQPCTEMLIVCYTFKLKHGNYPAEMTDLYHQSKYMRCAETANYWMCGSFTNYVRRSIFGRLLTYLLYMVFQLCFYCLIFGDSLKRHVAEMYNLADDNDPVAMYHTKGHLSANAFSSGMAMDHAAVWYYRYYPHHDAWDGRYLMKAVELGYPPAMERYAMYLDGFMEANGFDIPPNLVMPDGTERMMLAQQMRALARDAGYDLLG